MQAERRRHERMRIRGDARLLFEDGKGAHLQARDLSMSGAFVEAAPDEALALAPGLVVDLTLCPDEEAPHHAVVDGKSFHASARIVRAASSGFGLKFERIDVENEDRLRALLDVEGD